MTELEKIAIPELKAMLLSDSAGPIQKPSIGLALSGGVDSMVLLHLLLNEDICKLCGNLTAFHFNHGLRGEAADQDEQFLKTYCATLGVEYHSEKIAVLELVKNSDKSVEEAARELRYLRLTELKNEYKLDFIFLAHHEDDKAETVFFNIMRGCGLSGLSTLKSVNGIFRRPLLSISKSAIIDYALKAGLPVREDLTNRENDYSRNKIRNLLIPQIEETLKRNIVPSLIKLSKIAGESQDFITESCNNFLMDSQNVLLESNCVVIKKDAYLDLHPCLGKELFGLIFIKLGSLYRSNYLVNETVYTKIKNCNSFTEIWQGFEISLWQNYIFIANNKVPHDLNIKISFDQLYNLNGSSLILSCIKQESSAHYFSFEAVKGEIHAEILDRTLEFQPFGRTVPTPISKLLSDRKIPQFLRNKLFMLRDAEKVIFIPGLGIDNRVRVTDNSKPVAHLDFNDPVFTFIGTNQ